MANGNDFGKSVGVNTFAPQGDVAVAASSVGATTDLDILSVKLLQEPP